MKAAKLYSYTTISNMSNYIVPETIGVASRIEMGAESCFARKITKLS